MENDLHSGNQGNSNYHESSFSVTLENMKKITVPKTDVGTLPDREENTPLWKYRAGPTLH